METNFKKSETFQVDTHKIPGILNCNERHSAIVNGQKLTNTEAEMFFNHKVTDLGIKWHIIMKDFIFHIWSDTFTEKPTTVF